MEHLCTTRYRILYECTPGFSWLTTPLELLEQLKRGLPIGYTSLFVSRQAYNQVVVCIEFIKNFAVRPPGNAFNLLTTKGLPIIRYHATGHHNRHWEWISKSLDPTYYAYWSLYMTEDQFIDELRKYHLFNEYQEYILRTHIEGLACLPLSYKHINDGFYICFEKNGVMDKIRPYIE